MTQDLAQLWAQLAPELTRYFVQRLPNPADAEDMVSETFAILMQREDVRTPENLLRLIAHGLLMDAYKFDGIRKPELNDRTWSGVKDRTEFLRRETDPDYEPESHHLPSVEDVMFASEFDGAIRELDDDLRDAFILGELRGLTTREAGAVLGVSHVTANVRREIATDDIRKELV